MNAAGNGTFDVEAVARGMIAAARKALAGRGPALQAMAEMELRRLAAALADIGVLLARGDIDPDRAKVLANIHQLSFRSVLRSVGRDVAEVMIRERLAVPYVCGPDRCPPPRPWCN